MPSISGPTTVTEDDEDVTWTASGGTYDDLADWTYSDPQGILGVDGYGGNTFTAAKFYGTGTFTITVRNDQGETASLTVTVTEADPEPDPIYVTSVSLSTSSVSVANGGSTSLSGTYSPSNATNLKFSVETRNSTGAAGSEYRVSPTFNKNGTFSVSISADGPQAFSFQFRVVYQHNGSVATGWCTVNVTSTQATSISISGSSSIASGAYASYTATVSPSSATNKAVDWSISGPGTIWSQTDTTCRIRANGTGTIRLTATATDGSGVSSTKSISVYDDTIHTTSLVASPSTVNLYLDESVTVRFTASPSNTEDGFSFYVSSTSDGGISYFSYTRSQSGNVYSVTVTGYAVGTGGWIRVTSGSQSVTVPITVDYPPDYPVTDIEFPFTYVERFPVGGVSGVVQAQSRPVGAAIRGLTAEIISGSQFAHIYNYAETDIGCRFSVEGDALDNGMDAQVVVRVKAKDQGGYYEDVTFWVIGEPCTDIVLTGVDPGDGTHDGTLAVDNRSSTVVTATPVPDNTSRIMEWSVEPADIISAEGSVVDNVATVDVSGLVDGEAVLTFKCGEITKTILVTSTEIKEIVLTLDANGGTFPSGESVVTIRPPDGSYLLPDWSVVDRPGYRLVRWTGEQNGSAAMGSEQTRSDTWTAVWTADNRGYSTEYLPHAAIRIYRTLDQYIDATYLQVMGGEAAVSIAENQPGSATFTLINAYDTPGHSLLAEDCDLWSSGADGPIRTGMYVRIDDIRSDGTLRYLVDGFITTIKPNAENIVIEIGDRLTFLGKQGTTLRRNYYGGEGSRASMLVSAGNDGELYADLSELPDGATVDGIIQWTIPSTKSYSGTMQELAMGDGSPLFTYSAPLAGELLGRVKLGLRVVQANVQTQTYSFTAVVSTGSDSRTVELAPMSLGNGSEFDLDIDIGMMACGDSVTVTVYCDNYPPNGEFRLRTIADTTCRITFRGTGGDEMTFGRAIVGEIVTYTLADVVDGEASGTRYHVTQIDGVTDINDSTLWTPSANRALVPYVLSGSQSTVDVMEGIAWALGIMPMANVTELPRADTLVSIFRTGGGYALDYLQKLADIASSDGHMRTFSCRGFTTPILAIGARYSKEDAQTAIIHYAGDSPTGTGERVAFSAFTPSMTLKNRPSLVTLRGTISEKSSTESVPLQIAVEDVDVTEERFGVLVEAVLADSSIASMGDAGNAAWAELASAELDQWEGSVTIPGIRADMLALSGAHAGSGVPVRITDSRNGLDLYAARVRQVRADYNVCTTTLTLSNYTLLHSSGIADTAALAITSADIAAGANSTTLFNSQYARIKTSTDQAIGSGTGVTVRGHLTSGATFDFDSVSVFILPNGRHLVHAVALESNSGHAADDEVYAVEAVQIGSRDRLEIRPSVRPDYYRGQTLSVDIDCP